MNPSEWAEQASRDPRSWGHDPNAPDFRLEDLVEEVVRAAVADEREACAKLMEEKAAKCTSLDPPLDDNGFAGGAFLRAAALIRERTAP